MFKPHYFRFAEAIQWPGIGPTTELPASLIEDVKSDGDTYLFIHPTGHAVSVTKSQVTTYGEYKTGNIPELFRDPKPPKADKADKAPAEEGQKTSSEEDLSQDKQDKQGKIEALRELFSPPKKRGRPRKNP